MWRLESHGIIRGPALVAALLASAVAGTIPAPGEIKAGDAFPPLVAAGEAVSPAATAGKVVLVDFWASWCAPCRASFPAYEKILADFGARGLVIVGVSVDEQQSAYDAFVRKFSPTFRTWRDGSHALVRLVNVPAMPTCYLIGRDGRVRYVHAGFHGAATDHELRQELETLLTEPAPSS